MEQVRPQPAMNAPARRMSIFTEVGLVDEDKIQHERSPAPVSIALSRLRPARTVRFRSRNDIFGEPEERNEDDDWESVVDEDEACDALAAPAVRPSSPFLSSVKLYRLGLFALVVAMMLPIIQCNPMSRIGAKATLVPQDSVSAQPGGLGLIKREDTSTDACKRWAGQSAIVNGTLYMYGFRTITDAKQKSDTWTNDFLTLDLTKSWQVSTPALAGLPKPKGPPAVSLGQLWASLESLWLYGGQFSDTPKVAPGPNSLWEYKIANKQWVEHKDPKTSAGDEAEKSGQSVQRAAEGAGFSVASLGRGWYFGGHLDDFTTEGWSNQIKRVYLKGLLEFTFPGYTNNAVKTLQDGKKAGDEGVYRNITSGGLQNTGSFPARADGALVYVPGFGDEGLLISFTGGDNDTFTQMNVIDVYDIAKSTWYKQSTSGELPSYRVNPCTAVAAAADGSSYNVHLFGGQNLIPAGAQTQKDDMWILSIPSFKWIKVDQGGQTPYARAGHSCHVWDGQMIILGGYINPEIGCESPGIYVFNMSSLSWSDQFTSLTGNKALATYNPDDKDSIGNPLAQQANQRGFGTTAGLQGSYGYAVPEPVRAVIGGEATGGATLTAPVQTPTQGPLATGKPMTYTVTGPNGAVVTSIVGSQPPENSSGPNIAAIIAGVIAGVFAIIAAYFAFCAWVYRKQVQIWKNHAAVMTTRANEKTNTFTSSANYSSSERPPGTMGSAGGAAAGSFDISRGSAEGQTGYLGRRNSVGSIMDDLLDGQEPSFWGTRGVLLNPRKSLRVVNRD